MSDQTPVQGALLETLRPLERLRPRKVHHKRQTAVEQSQAVIPTLLPEDVWGSADAEQAFNNIQAQEPQDRVFFDKLTIAQDGGITEIKSKEADLWYSSRYLSTFLVCAFVVYNMIFIIETDVGALLDIGGGQPMENLTSGDYMITASIATRLGYTPSEPENIVYCFELTVLLLFVLKGAFEATMIFFPTNDYRKWMSTAALGWRTIPDLSSFSALKVLQFVVPQKLMYDLNYILWYSPPGFFWYLKLLAFMIRTPVALIIGLDCFLIKIRLGLTYIHTKECNQHNILMTVVLLNQILGVVQIGKTINNRLYRFVFAGEDGVMTLTEKVRQNVWEASIVQEIFKQYPRYKAVAMLMSWCDDDFQMMILNEGEDFDP